LLVQPVYFCLIFEKHVELIIIGLINKVLWKKKNIMYAARAEDVPMFWAIVPKKVVKKWASLWKNAVAAILMATKVQKDVMIVALAEND